MRVVEISEGGMSSDQRCENEDGPPNSREFSSDFNTNSV